MISSFSSIEILSWSRVYAEYSARAPKNWCFRTVVLEKTVESSWIARRSNQSILKEINSEYSLEGLVLKLKLQYSGHLMQKADSLEKTLLLGKIKGRRRRTEDGVVRWHHRLNGHEFEETPGDGERQGSLACCSPWGCKESDMTEQMNWTEPQCSFQHCLQ